MTQMITAGIDVAARTLMVDVLHDGERSRRSKPWTVDNHSQGHEGLIEQMRALRVDRIVCEATGVYHLDLAMALVQAQLPVMVANPRQVKAFIEARLRNSQSDPVDAHELAQFALRMPFVPWQAPKPSHYALHRIARSLQGYVAQATAAMNRRHAAQAVRDTPKAVLKAIETELAMYESIQDKLRAQALKIIAKDTDLSHKLELLKSAPGIAQTSAIPILGELCVLQPGLRAAAWVKLAGLDPTRKQSGTSVLGKAHISNRGNRYLRGNLFMPAMCARRCDPGLRAFADRLVARGKTKKQAILAVERKMVHGIHAMFSKNQPWNSQALIPNQANSG